MRLVVIGDPVDHSLSPVLHHAAFASVGLRGTYGRRKVDAEGVRRVVDEIRRGELDGANVTMPHKALAAATADRCAATARRAGAVNTLVRVGDDVVGHNTDVAGVLQAAEWAGLPSDGPVLVLGAGGAAAAALLALEGRPLFLSARRPDAASALLERVGIEAELVPWGTGRPGAVLVNATSIGMDAEPLPHKDLIDHTGLLDMPYGRTVTPAVVAMQAAGRPVADGPDMLLGQAVAAFRLWTGRDPDVDDMRAAMVAARAASSA